MQNIFLSISILAFSSVWAQNLMQNEIDHVVILMLENRSFDCMLGKLYAPSPQFDWLTGTEFNVDAAGNKIISYSSEELNAGDLHPLRWQNRWNPLSQGPRH